MTQSTSESNPHRTDPSLAYASHAIRLSARELLVVGLVCVTVLLAVPRVWRQVETFEPELDYRVPYSASEDYWVYRRWAETVAAQGRVLVIGDSVVWGEYVTPEQTLTHYLNERAGGPRFANGGLNGSHPLALGGLVRDFAQAISDTHVILHCNLLWLSAHPS